MRWQRRGKLHLVLALSRRDHLPKHRLRRGGERQLRDLCALGAERVAGLRRVELAEADRLADFRRPALGRLLARPSGKCRTLFRGRRAAV